MATKYVDNTIGPASCTTYDPASRSCSGGTASAWKTLQAAITAVLSPGDILYIRGGTVYTEGIIDSTSFGNSSQSITIAGYPGDTRPIIRPPSNYAASIEAWYVAFDAARVGRFLVMRDFEIDGINLPDESGACLQIQAPNVTVENLIIRQPPRDGIRMFSKNITVRNCQIINCGRTQPAGAIDTKGLGLYLAPDIANDAAAIGGSHLIENNIIEGCRGGGAVVHYGDGVNNANITFRRNIFRNFGDFSPWNSGGWPAGAYSKTCTGINFGGAGINGNGNVGPRNVVAENNIFYNLTAPDFGNGHVFWGADQIKLYNNTYYNVSHQVYRLLCTTNNTNFILQNNIWSLVGSQTNFTEPDMGCSVVFTPKTITNNLLNPTVASTFLNAAGGDFHLIAGATAIDAGFATGVANDFDGTVRPFNFTLDIGAFEFVGGSGGSGPPPPSQPPSEPPTPPAAPPPSGGTALGYFGQVSGSSLLKSSANKSFGRTWAKDGNRFYSMLFGFANTAKEFAYWELPAPNGVFEAFQKGMEDMIAGWDDDVRTFQDLVAIHYSTLYLYVVLNFGAGGMRIYRITKNTLNVVTFWTITGTFSNFYDFFVLNDDLIWLIRRNGATAWEIGYFRPTTETTTFIASVPAQCNFSGLFAAPGFHYRDGYFYIADGGSGTGISNVLKIGPVVCPSDPTLPFIPPA